MSLLEGRGKENFFFKKKKKGGSFSKKKKIVLMLNENSSDEQDEKALMKQWPQKGKLMKDDDDDEVKVSSEEENREEYEEARKHLPLINKSSNDSDASQSLSVPNMDQYDRYARTKEDLNGNVTFYLKSCYVCWNHFANWKKHKT
ncbi:hypothetical protein RFI_17593 [Reticulomyxa filosa]|uniref:Uncharacterized protein n=1 Tax=Reticulomyxa filosa TaxID=46433 RepID=X6N1M0_RETFI|nr:hypothetical protein RFI_17593 [Reticulomyxa filosa]|eukprot:ETO19634.1 hypothetical protein RFI_17593 [Reticulomyxa filosa]